MADLMTHVAWWTSWQERINDAKRYTESHSFQLAAAICQVQYLCYSAIYWATIKPT